MVEIVRVFAFGTLKKGFVLHQRGLAGAHYCGRAQTRKAYPMVIAGQWFAPMMFDEPGTGSIVSGELYELSGEMLSKLDRLESVGQPGHFRKRIELETASGNLADAFAYFKARRLAVPIYTGYLSTYDDDRFVPTERRS
ncbi:gamma-glutamylcyclotransferase [Rhizobium sp. NBRC 114257]|uniref:Gamma-glutamylcyclotransferase family protein n=1 Tax=Rhizobium dioscoreae TaxID=2653122 RepID=A0ABQ0Z9W0_9HYPH|nr:MULTISPECIES: gamma-glutamylcyclotransferase family protein [Rhizobium]GES52087.1 gamma-glutamylcyclotransferase [Rhizobium dioscoreae]GLU83194.1 gamma-glutamylcyclotransferase [Rhizobium sp. NBRC 114257]